MRAFKPTVLAVAALSLIGTTLIGSPAFASGTTADVGTEQTPAPAATASAGTGEEVRFGPSLEHSVLIGVSGEDPAAKSGTVSPQSIPFNPNDSLQCDALNNADYVLADIYSYAYSSPDGSQTLWPGGDIDLLCGTDNSSGFKHIRSRHQYPSFGAIHGWETVRASASDALGYTAPQSWDEFMIHAVHDTLDYSYPSPQVNNEKQKVCFSAPFHIYKGASIYASYYANTVVSKNNFIIVTAFLSNVSQASACYDGWDD